jgi:hypothetical protein
VGGVKVTQSGGEIFGLGAELRERLTSNAPRTILDSKTEEGELQFALDCVMAAIGSMFKRASALCYLPEGDTLKKRTGILAACCQGISPIEDCIFRGFYVQAATLIRQEMEAVEASRSLRVGRYIEGSKKNSSLFVLRHLGKIYGQLTDIAHLQRSSLVLHLVGENSPSIDPIRNPEFESFLLKTHIYALTGITLELGELVSPIVGSSITDGERDCLVTSQSVLAKHGFIQLN